MAVELQRLRVGLLVREQLRDELLRAVREVTSVVSVVAAGEVPCETDYDLLIVDDQLSTQATELLAGTDMPIIQLVSDGRRPPYQYGAVWGYLPVPIRSETVRPALSLALDGFHHRNRLKREVDDLRNPLESRKTIERAKGLIMRRSGVTAEDALERIQRLASENNRPIEDIAKMILAADSMLGFDNLAETPSAG